jgi:SAM-dependent methyltransferase
MAPAPNGNARAYHLCERLLRQWDPMFSRTIDPTRDRRSAEIVAALAERPPGPFRVLELGSGPGPLTEKLLRRFRTCRVVSLDHDPVLLRIGELALRRFHSRATWVLADLRARDWRAELPFQRFDAVVSSLTLHWLEEDEIRNVYRNLHRLLKPGGSFVDGDFLPSRSSREPPERARRRRPAKEDSRLRAFKVQWGTWWNEVATDRSLKGFLREREVRLPGPFPPRRTSGPKTPAPLEFHLEALRAAGFLESHVAWHDRGFRVLVAAR